jgi:6-phosphogluconate dehydrogenase
MAKGQFGVAGLGVMGQHIALNIERNGFGVVGYNRGADKAEQMRQMAQGKNLQVTSSIEELAGLLEKPRRVLLMVTAGAATDAVIADLKKVFEPGDIIIDGGNSYFLDTNRRQKEMAGTGLHFVGCGISGGEEGALWGPSIMPGGDKEAYAKIEPILTKIAAKTEDGPCVTYVGAGSAGHYVKMVHNGIEYGIMQVICEVYDLLRKAGGMSSPEIGEVFGRWKETEVSGFLVEITEQCLTKKDDETGKPLVELIVDTAGQKGTGKWTAQSSLDLGVPIPTLSMAVEARILSGLKAQRVEAAKVLQGPAAVYRGDRGELIETAYGALHLSMVACYAQGMALIQEASKEYNYGVNCSDVARIWKGGCIIRSRLLDPIKKAYAKNPNLVNLLPEDAFRDKVNSFLPKLRAAVKLAAETGVPATCLGATLAYVDSYRSEFLPANLLQALRDNFGAHTYQRLDRPGVFHTEWNK